MAMTQRTIFMRTLVAVFLCLISAVQGLAQPTMLDSVELGKRLYHEGITVTGELVQAVTQHDIAISGQTAACVKCHRASGFGSSEGGYYVPPITGPFLFAPRKLDRIRLFPDLFQQVQPPTFSARLRQPHMRPAYTRDSLSATLRDGIDSGGQRLAAIMPRYQLSEADMTALLSYLNTLSTQISPGVDEKHIHFAMVLTDNIPAIDRDAVLETMRVFVDWHNQHLRYDRARPNFSPYHRTPFVPLERLWSFSVLTLTGESETWKQQMEDLYRGQPFFAVVRGLVQGVWQPIADFCDHHHVPCLLPITDLPVAGAKGGYSVYFSEGLTLEAKVLVKYLLQADFSMSRVVQLAASDSFGQIPSTIVADQLTDSGMTVPPEMFTYHDDTELSQQLSALARELTADDVLVVWPGADAQTAIDMIMHHRPSVRLLILPSRAMAFATTESDPEWSHRVHFLEPHEISVTSHPRSFVVRAWMRTRGLQITRPTLQFETYYALSLLEAALMNIREDYHRDYLLERIERESEKDLNPGIYPRLALGPTQRFASKGAYVVRKDPMQPGRMIPVSEWLVP